MKLRRKSEEIHYYNVKDTYAVRKFTNTLYNLIKENAGIRTDIIILCIGTDRATGDCLGPIVGYKLKKMFLDNVTVYGTLSQPVHAKKNIEETILTIQKKLS